MIRKDHTCSCSCVFKGISELCYIYMVKRQLGVVQNGGSTTIFNQPVGCFDNTNRDNSCGAHLKQSFHEKKTCSLYMPCVVFTFSIYPWFDDLSVKAQSGKTASMQASGLRLTPAVHGFYNRSL